MKGVMAKKLGVYLVVTALFGCTPGGPVCRLLYGDDKGIVRYDYVATSPTGQRCYDNCEAIRSGCLLTLNDNIPCAYENVACLQGCPDVVAQPVYRAVCVPPRE